MQHAAAKWVGLCLIVALAAPVRAGDPVEQLRQLLRTRMSDSYERDRGTQACLTELRHATTLLQALQLEEWQDMGADQTIAFVDRGNRARIVDNLERALRELFAQEDDASRLAAINVVASMGVTARDTVSTTGLARRFTRELADQCGSDKPAVQLAALRALGKVHPRPDLAVAALRQQQEHEQLEQRRAVAQSLYQLVKIDSELACQRQRSNGVASTPTEFVELGVQVVPVAVLGLDDEDDEVRKYSLAAVAQAATALRSLAAHLGGDDDPRALLPLFEALRAQGDRLKQNLTDTSRAVGVLARWTLEETAAAQQALIRASALAGQEAPTWATDVVDSLVTNLADPDVRVRRASLDVLETLGRSAAPAAEPIIKSLEDEDRFVRWAAARTLGKLGTEVSDQAVPALVSLLNDRDIDLRLTALHALEQFGRHARPALPALLGLAVDRNVDLRVASLHLVAAIGPEAEPALPALLLALDDASPRVRCQAARTLGALGSVAQGALPPLYRLLNDQDGSVREAAGQALIRIKGDVDKSPLTSPPRHR